MTTPIAAAASFRPIEPISPMATPAVAPGAAVQGAAPGGFGALLDKIASTEQAANTAGVDTVTGKITNLQDFTAAAAKAQLSVQLTVALRNRAVEAYNEIMRMQV